MNVNDHRKADVNCCINKDFINLHIFTKLKPICFQTLIVNVTSQHNTLCIFMILSLQT